MYKTTCVLALIGFLMGAAAATHPFSSYHEVSWDSASLAWRVDDVLLGEINAAAHSIVLLNITSGGGEFFISERHCALGSQYALSRKNGVTNNACTPPCTMAMNLSAMPYFYCSSRYPENTAGIVIVSECGDCSSRICGNVVGCGWSSDDKKCVECTNAKTRGDCSKISACSWCETDEVCLHENSGVCRPAIARVRAVASWVWLLITVCALVVLIAVVITLFLNEASFKKRWATLAKTDKEFAEIGRGNNDGLLATD